MRWPAPGRDRRQAKPSGPSLAAQNDCDPMVAMPLARPDFSEPLLAPKRSAAPTPFQPLDADVLNASIPAFYIGCDKDGFWLARDAKGRLGGLFLLQSSAVAFARRRAWPSGCATVFSSEVVELDVENQSNPLIEYLRPVMRLLMQGLHRISALASAFFDFVGGRS